jgi:hypothetical protein
MSVLFALMLAASPTATPAGPVQAKPRKKCEYISEVGSNRPRRVCQIVQPKAPEDQASDAGKAAADHSQHQQGTSE